MGLEPVWKECAYLLVSDCGAPFDFEVGKTPWSRLLRYTTVVTSQTRALRLRALFAEWNDGAQCKEYEGAYWGLTTGLKDPAPTEAGYSKEMARDVIANIRTDLDSFSDAEMSVLENHGYLTADQSIQRYLRGLVTPAPVHPPYPQWLDEAKARKALRNSHKRFSVVRLLRGVQATGK
jgi:NTE family protein